jgi:hypothetical protein
MEEGLHPHRQAIHAPYSGLKNILIPESGACLAASFSKPDSLNRAGEEIILLGLKEIFSVYSVTLCESS